MIITRGDIERLVRNLKKYEHDIMEYADYNGCKVSDEDYKKVVECSSAICDSYRILREVFKVD